jgi:hypothetical protein
MSSGPRSGGGRRPAQPRGLLVVHPGIALRRRLDTLEHAAIILRGIARSLADMASSADESSPPRHPDTAGSLTGVLRELAAAVRDYGWLTRSQAMDRDIRHSDLERHLATAQEHQDNAIDMLVAEPVRRPDWPLRGELVTHLDRLRNELVRGEADLERRTSAAQRWRHPVRTLRSWLRPVLPAQIRRPRFRSAWTHDRPRVRSVAALPHAVSGPGEQTTSAQGEPSPGIAKLATRLTAVHDATGIMWRRRTGQRRRSCSLLHRERTQVEAVDEPVRGVGINGVIGTGGDGGGSGRP